MTNSLATIAPDLAKEFHPTKNGILTPADVIAGTNKKLWWLCPNGPDHEWEAVCMSRLGGVGCPSCANVKVSVTNSLATIAPDLAKEFHPTKNGILTPADVIAGTNKKLWWLCPNGPDHEWEAVGMSRLAGAGCPYCNQDWTVRNVRLFVKSLLPIITTLSAADLFKLLQQAGLRKSTGKSRDFIRLLSTGRIPPSELASFVDGEPSIVDGIIDGVIDSLTEEDTDLEVQDSGESDSLVSNEDGLDEDESSSDHSLPEVSTALILDAFDSEIFASYDKEAVEYLIASGVGKLWGKVYQPGDTDIDGSHADAVAIEAESFVGERYGQEVRNRFLAEYYAAKDLTIPPGYSFQVEGRGLTMQNLMQRHAASLVKSNRLVGNWSGTGAGKTLSAVLASRVIDSRLTIVCCPNAVVDGWATAIQGIFPDSDVLTKTWDPVWKDGSKYRYLVLNYEMFQLEVSSGNIKRFLESATPAFIVIDEIHFAKQASPNGMSHRREMVIALVTNSTDANSNLYVLGMSATPVINNLQEGRSMIEMITGREFADTEVSPSVDNAMRVHQQFVRLGIRWMPKYDAELIEERPVVDCSEYLDEIRSLGSGAILPLELILTRAKLPEIIKNIEKKTLIYTLFRKGIDRTLRDAIVKAGWKVAFYNGDDKTGLDGFLDGDVDVLIATSAISTGVDGLQRVCKRLIVNVLPWTAAEYQQLKGRIYRQGQSADQVKVIIPTTYANVGSERWSWCESKWRRVEFKKSLADAAVDGVVPEGRIPSPAQAYKYALEWLARLDSGAEVKVNRPRLSMPLVDNTDDQLQARTARYGDFSRMNRHWNTTNSANTHSRLATDPGEWQHYHLLYREARKDWTVVPYEEMIRELSLREGYVVGDFGCGEALLAEGLADKCTVHSFDHVAINESVIACDIADVPIDDEELDVAVFCLSLMGSNFTQYLKEAHRTLKLDGRLHIYEATSRFSDRDRFAADLRTLGFSQIEVNDSSSKFTYIVASKTDSDPKSPPDKIAGLTGDPD